MTGDHGASRTRAASRSSRTARRRSWRRTTASRSARSARSAASACSRASTSRPAKAAWSSRDDAALARRVFLFVNKAWGYGDPNPDHYFLALNYRHERAAGGVSPSAQLPKLDGVVDGARRAADADGRAARRHCRASRRRTATRDDVHTYWKYCLRVDPAVIAGGAGGAGEGAEGAGHRVGAALHPEAGVPVRGVPRAADLRQQPLAVHAGPARGGRLLGRAVPRHVRGPRPRARAAVEREVHARAPRLHRRGDPRAPPTRLRGRRCRVSTPVTIRAGRRRRHRPELRPGVREPPGREARRRRRRPRRGRRGAGRAVRLPGVRRRTRHLLDGGPAFDAVDRLHAAEHARGDRHARSLDRRRPRAVREAVRADAGRAPSGMVAAAARRPA